MTRSRTVHRALVLAIALPVALLVGACGSEGEAVGDALTSAERSDATERPGSPGATTERSATTPAVHDPAAADQLSLAATRSAEQQWASYRMRISAGDQVLSETAGVGDPSGTVFDGTTTVPGAGQMGYRVVDGIAYVETPNLPNGATWIAISLAELGAQMDMDLGVQQAFDLLHTVGDVVEVGPEQLEGVPTTRYELRTTVEAMMRHSAAAGVLGEDALAAAEIFQGEVRMDIWIGDDGLLRRLHYSLPLAPGAPGAPADAITYTFELSDYGAPHDVVAPPPESVISMADAMSVPN